MALMNLYDAEEVDFESSLIPDGTLVSCTVLVKKVKTNDKGNTFMDCELVVREGRYKGTKFFDNIGVSGSEGFVRLGKSKMKAILETGRNALNPADYEFDTNQLTNTFNGLQALVRVKVDTYLDKNDVGRYKNVVHSYGSANPDSSRFHLYQSYVKGEQPFQTAELPPLPAPMSRAHPASNAYNPQSAYGEPPAYINDGPGY